GCELGCSCWRLLVCSSSRETSVWLSATPERLAATLLHTKRPVYLEERKRTRRAQTRVPLGGTDSAVASTEDAIDKREGGSFRLANELSMATERRNEGKEVSATAVMSGTVGIRCSSSARSLGTSAKATGAR